MTRKTILVFADFFLPGFKAGGPVRSIVGIMGALSEEFDFLIVTRDRDFGDTEPYSNVKSGAWNQIGSAKVFYVAPGVRGWWQLLHCLRNTRYDMIYFNSFLSPVFSVMPNVAHWMRLLRPVPIVIAPRGELGRGALGLKAAKKRAFIALSKLIGLHKHASWHASNTEERDDIVAQFGRWEPRITIASNLSSHTLPQARERGTKTRGSARFVLLSRLSRKKNVTFALQVLVELKGDVTLDIYGPREDAKYWNECEALINRLPPNVTARYAGITPPENVGAVLGGYDFFFLPTLGENFGHVVLEALSAGLPVILSDRTPWRGLSERGAGWDISLEDVGEFTRVLRTCVEMGTDEYARLSESARRLAAEYLNDRAVLEANRSLFATAERLGKPRRYKSLPT